MNYSEIIKKVSGDINLSPDTVDKVYKAYWKFIRNHIESLPLKNDLTEEEFNKLKTNINIPSIGKFSLSYDRYKRIKDAVNRACLGKSLKNKDNEEVN